MARKTSGRDRYQYGICTNTDTGEGQPCPLCRSKELQKVRAGQELLCRECGQPMMMAKAPVSWWDKNKTWCMAVAAVAVLGGGGFGLWKGFSGGPTESGGGVAVVDSDSIRLAEQQLALQDSLKRVQATADSLQRVQAEADSIAKAAEEAKNAQAEVAKKPVNNPQPAPKPGGSTLRLSYGTYKGETKNGYPDGMGRLTYTASRQINRYDEKGRMAEPGDYIQGEFVRGFVVMGKWYDANGNLKGSLNIGVQAGNNYEAK